MEKNVNIELTPKEVAEAMFCMDDEQVAEVFREWSNVFDENMREAIKENKHAWVHDLSGFMYYLIPKLCDKGQDVFRMAYAQLLYRKLDDNCHKWLL